MQSDLLSMSVGKNSQESLLYWLLKFLENWCYMSDQILSKYFLKICTVWFMFYAYDLFFPRFELQHGLPKMLR